MNDDELKKLWNEQPLRDPALSAAQVLSAVESKMTGLRSTLFWRDVGEILACAVVVILFGFFYYREPSPISRLGDLIVIGSSIFIAFKLIYTRRTTPSAPPCATVVESLQAELNAVRAQSELLGSVLWWYLLPLGIGIMVCTWGSLTGADGLGVKIGYTVVVIALYAFIYWLNQHARTKQLLPIEAQFESLLRSAQTGEPLDETQIANLRPIVLSMAAAERVKPAEFKVSFWQLAVIAEIGFVGIWVFLMVEAATDNTHWKTEQRARVTATQPVHFDATNSYSIVARKVVDLFNVGDYAGIEKLYNRDMRKAFPPKDTFDFYTRLAAGFGKIETIEGPTGKGYSDWTAFRLHCHYGDIILSVALDEDDEISGIYFEPVLPPGQALTFALVMRRVFTLKHLVWLVLLFLGGLLEAWVIQKRTERSVGISSLGIHWNQGMDFILWDEIKEVRRFRILQIRNLWLVKESGEKHLIHWTPLERHADVKAAVEKFAPPNHPIREHLSLLK